MEDAICNDKSCFKLKANEDVSGTHISNQNESGTLQTFIAVNIAKSSNSYDFC